MKLSKIKISNFRKLNDVEVSFGDATFLIGANNAGKSSTLEAIEYLLSDGNKLSDLCRSKFIDTNGNENVNKDDVVIEGTFVDVSPNIVENRGFNPDRLKVDIDDEGNKKYSFKYRIRLSSDGKSHREMQMNRQKLKDIYSDVKKWRDFVDKGAPESLFLEVDLDKNISPKEKKDLEFRYPELFDVESVEEWFENPGGIAANVISKLPRYLIIKANLLSEEIDGDKSSTLHSLLSLIFNEVREQSDHYKKAAKELELLSKEMDPTDENGGFGKLMKDLNKVVDDVFPKASINVATDLSGADSLKPKFDVTMSSNVTTDVLHQGTGLIRSAVFALLRFNKQRVAKDENVDERGLIVAFEEPELFLHPSAAENMRRVIYELAGDNSQIVATTHSPYMIDLSQHPKQILNSYRLGENDFSEIVPFNLSDAFQNILDDEKARVKMMQKIDDYVARVFFAQRVIIVEGDTEDIIFKHSISILPEKLRKEITSKYQIIKATGKATMISFIKYLKALNVDLFVVHDEDADTDGAKKMNNPILKALGGDETKRLMMKKCIEDELGYTVPTKDKPYNAYKFVQKWKSWNNVPDKWQNIMKRIFPEIGNVM